MATSGDDDRIAELLVEADRMIEAGDPRGSLIHVQHQRSSNPDDVKLYQEERRLLNKHSKLLHGPFRPRASTWRLGHIHTTTIEAVTPSKLREMLAHPSARYLQEVVLYVDEDVTGVAGELAASAPHLERLEIRQRYVGGHTKPIAFPSAAWPKLHKLVLDRCWKLFETLDHPTLASLELEGLPTPPVGWNLPNLRVLEWSLWSNELLEPTDHPLEAFDSLWRGSLPQLVFLRFKSVNLAGDLATYPPLRRLAERLRLLSMPGTFLATRDDVERWLRG